MAVKPHETVSTIAEPRDREYAHQETSLVLCRWNIWTHTDEDMSSASWGTGKPSEEVKNKRSEEKLSEEAKTANSQDDGNIFETELREPVSFPMGLETCCVKTS